MNNRSAEIVDVFRKTSVLSRPTLPCLSAHHTINLMAGCPHQCLYCYAQSFRSHLGKDKIEFYANAIPLLRDEMTRKRKKPTLVYFSTACEPFAPIPKVLASLYEAMQLLLGHSVFLLISSKSEIPENFLQLFARHPNMVHVQIGLTTTNDAVRRLLEPNAATVTQRLETLNSLVARGISAAARMDPLIPELTDTESSFDSLCASLAKTGARTAVASYLFLRNANYRRLAVELDGWSFLEMSKRLYSHRVRMYCGGGDILIPAASYRKKKYPQLIRIAQSHGIKLSLCQCKNPDIVTNCCHPNPSVHYTKQAELF
jgi:DNA repair photolyase